MAETKGRKSFFMWVTALGIPAIILAIGDTNSPLTVFFTITVWALLTWCFDILPADVVGFLLPVLFIVTNTATVKLALSPWSGTVPWMVLGAMIIGEVMISTGLALRIADGVLRMIGSSFNRILAAIMFAGIIIAPLIPSSTAKLAILGAVGVGICRSNGYAPKSHAATAIMLTAFLAVRCPAQSYLTGSARIPMTMDFVRNLTNISVGWSEYAYHNWLLGMLYSVVSLLIVILLLKPEAGMQNSIYQTHKECMGPMMRDEKKMVLVLVFLIGLLMTDSMHGVNAAWVLMIAAGLLFFPGLELMNHASLRKVNFSLLFYLTGALAAGVVAEKVGAVEWVGKLLLPVLQGSPVYTIISVYFFGIGSALIFHVFGSLAAFTAPLTKVAMQLDMNPYAVIYSFKYGLDQVAFPFEDSLLLYLFSFNYASLSSIVKVLAVKALVVGAFMLLMAYPYWRLIGLL